MTDARFSGVSTGACIGHVGPEALAGGPIGKLVDGDIIEIVIDRRDLSGQRRTWSRPAGSDARPPEAAGALLAARPPHPDLRPHAELPDDTRLWAALQAGERRHRGRGCVYDVDRIVERDRARGSFRTGARRPKVFRL